MKIEWWKYIKGFVGLYMVSTFGRVKSFPRNGTIKKERILTPSLTTKNNGYPFVVLCKNGNRFNRTVHRLVAEAFIPNPLNLPEINHINQDKTDNRVENIEWCDRTYNVNFGDRTKRSAAKRSTSVNSYTLEGVFVHNFPSIAEAERITGIPHGNIVKCCKGERKYAGNSQECYIWRYAD